MLSCTYKVLHAPSLALPRMYSARRPWLTLASFLPPRCSVFPSRYSAPFHPPCRGLYSTLLSGAHHQQPFLLLKIKRWLLAILAIHPLTTTPNNKKSLRAIVVKSRCLVRCPGRLWHFSPRDPFILQSFSPGVLFILRHFSPRARFILRHFSPGGSCLLYPFSSCDTSHCVTPRGSLELRCVPTHAPLPP